MKYLLPAALVLAGTSAFAGGQERKVPNDSARITIQGCAKGRSFIVGERRAEDSVNLDVAPGRRFRLSGPKDILEEIKKRERSEIQVTGLVRKNDLAGPGGIPIAGGRVRIGGGSPSAPLGGASATRVQGYQEAVIDVEGWRALAEPCPDR